MGVRDVLVRMVEANNRNNSESRIILDHVLTTIDMEDSYKLSTTSEWQPCHLCVCGESGSYRILVFMCCTSFFFFFCHLMGQSVLETKF